MYYSIWHLLIEQLAALAGLSLCLYYGRKDRYLRAMAGGWLLAASFLGQLLLFLYPTAVRPIPPRAAVILHFLQESVFIGGMLLLARELTARKILRNAYHDPESGLPGRSAWEREKRQRLAVRSDGLWVVDIVFTDIATTRELSPAERERAFFDWLGSILERKFQDKLPGFVARTGIRTVSVLLEADNADHAVERIETLVNLLRVDLRAAGFTVDYEIIPEVPEKTIF